MKKINNIVLLTAALAASMACQKAEINEQKPQSEGRITVLVTTEEISTRTAFGTLSGNKYPTLWQTDDEVKFSLNKAEGVSATADVVGGGATAKFSPSFTDVQAESYTIYAVSPASAATSFAENSISVNIPSVQTSGKSSCDPAAQLLYAQSEPSTEKPTEFKARFQHLTSYLKVTLKTPEGTAASKLKIDFPSPVAGEFAYNFSDGSLTGGSSNSIEVTTENNTFWIACVPADLAGQNAVVEFAEPDKHLVYQKTVTFPSDDKFKMQAGCVYGLTLDFTKDVTSFYERVVTPGEEAVVLSSNDMKVENEVVLGMNLWNKTNNYVTYNFSDVPEGGEYDIIMRSFYWLNQVSSFDIYVNDAEEPQTLLIKGYDSDAQEHFTVLKNVQLKEGANSITVKGGAAHRGWNDTWKYYPYPGWMMVTKRSNDRVQSEQPQSMKISHNDAKLAEGMSLTGTKLWLQGHYYGTNKFATYTFENVGFETVSVWVESYWGNEGFDTSLGIKVNGGDLRSIMVKNNAQFLTAGNSLKFSGKNICDEGSAISVQPAGNVVIEVGGGNSFPYDSSRQPKPDYPYIGDVTIYNW